MAYKILTKNSIDNTNIDGARAEHFNAGMRDGIVKGAFNEGTFTTLASNEISFDTCELRISGHRVIIEEAWTRTFSTKPKTPVRYALIGQIIVGEDSSVQFDLFPQLASTALIKNNLFRQQNGAGTYQVEIGRFTLNIDGNIIDVTRTLDIITGSKGEDLDGTINIGVVTTNTLEPEMDAEADVEQRYDAEQGKVVTDFTFNIPRGKGLEDLDTELSESSTNAVQNSVITTALKNKADLTNPEQNITAQKVAFGSDNAYVRFNSGTDTLSIVGNGHGINMVTDKMVKINSTDDDIWIWTDGINKNIDIEALGGKILLQAPKTEISGELSFSALNNASKKILLDFQHPVNSIIEIEDDTFDPNVYYAGTGSVWQRLPDGYVLWSASSGAGTTIPAGLPNISGWANNAVGDQAANSFGGAIDVQVGGRGFTAGDIAWANFSVNASRSSPIYGNSDTVQPPARKTCMWKRIS